MWEAVLRRKRLDQSHDVIRRPRGPSCPDTRGPYGGWTSYRRVGEGKELTEPGGGRTPRVGRSLGEVPSAAPGGL